MVTEAKVFILASDRAVLSFETAPNTSDMTGIADGDDLSLLLSVKAHRYVRFHGTIK